jgi:hypothetical protein
VIDLRQRYGTLLADALATAPIWFYLAVHAAAAAGMVVAFAGNDFSDVLSLYNGALLAAGGAAAGVLGLRFAVVIIRINDGTPLPIGPGFVTRALIDAADLALERRKAVRHSVALRDYLAGIRSRISGDRHVDHMALGLVDDASLRALLAEILNHRTLSVSPDDAENDDNKEREVGAPDRRLAMLRRLKDLGLAELRQVRMPSGALAETTAFPTRDGLLVGEALGLAHMVTLASD